MKVNESKKWERVKIQQLKQEYFDLLEKISTVEKTFTASECRHRKGDLCGHGRQAVKKYPGHNPIVPLCAIPVCPL